MSMKITYHTLIGFNFGCVKYAQGLLDSLAYQSLTKYILHFLKGFVNQELCLVQCILNCRIHAYICDVLLFVGVFTVVNVYFPYCKSIRCIHQQQLMKSTFIKFFYNVIKSCNARESNQVPEGLIIISSQTYFAYNTLYVL